MAQNEYGEKLDSNGYRAQHPQQEPHLSDLRAVSHRPARSLFRTVPG